MVKEITSEQGTLVSHKFGFYPLKGIFPSSGTFSCKM